MNSVRIHKIIKHISQLPVSELDNYMQQSLIICISMKIVGFVSFYYQNFNHYILKVKKNLPEGI